MPQSDPIIRFQKVSKSFTLAHQRTLKEFIHALFVRRKTLELIHALKSLSFDVHRAESVGIIGRNGAGKSTLLKLIAGVTSATSGLVSIHERVHPLIELGAGFHPELTGKENVYLNGVILGMSEDSITEHYDEIVSYAMLRDFMDVPLKYYSSGMQMRLAFAVATCTVPQLLLVDEILAVGDQKFQDKCLKRMHEYQERGTSIIIVAHDRRLISEFCHRVLYLKEGKLKFDGPVDEGMRLYENEN